MLFRLGYYLCSMASPPPDPLLMTNFGKKRLEAIGAVLLKTSARNTTPPSAPLLRKEGTCFCTKFLACHLLFKQFLQVSRLRRGILPPVVSVVFCGCLLCAIVLRRNSRSLASHSFHYLWKAGRSIKSTVVVCDDGAIIATLRPFGPSHLQ